MTRSLKIILFSISGFTGILILVGLVLLLVVNTNANKLRLEAIVSETLGMEVSVGGRMCIRFFPDLSVTLEDVHIRNQDMDVVSSQEGRFEIDFLSLLRREVRIGKITLNHPSISIMQDRDGTFNFEKTGQARGTLPVLNLPEISIANGTFFYADKQSGDEFAAVDCDIEVHSLQPLSSRSPDPLKNLSFTAELACGETRIKDFAVPEVKFSVVGKEGVFELNPVLLNVFGGKGSGSLLADFSGAVPRYHARFSLAQFHLEKLTKAMSPDMTIEGRMDFAANLSTHGKSTQQVKEGMAGQITLRGNNLLIKGSDLDLEFARFESSQNFNLVDVGAVFFAGPFGLLATKGFNIAYVFRGSEGSSQIHTLVSDWKIEHGIAQAQDVAMATNENRVALRGEINLVTEHFNEMTVALIDAQGCTKVEQKIHGSFQEPEVDAPNIIRSLSGPMVNLVKKGMDLMSIGDCEVFYAGSVPPPK